jgi:hypothetical protein
MESYVERLTPEAMTRENILGALADIEKNHQVDILYAIQDGSHAWGFAGPKSDHDVRFIFMRQPEAYLTVGELPPSTIRVVSSGLDLVGWDLRHALRLFVKPNVCLLEWLRMPVIYKEVDPLIRQLRSLAAGRIEPRVMGPRAAPTHPAQPITIQEMDALFQEKILQKFLARVCA